MKQVKLSSFLGMNNRLPPERLRVKDGLFVVSAVNGDFTDAGTFRRRAGFVSALSGTAAHSFWSNGKVPADGVVVISGIQQQVGYTTLLYATQPNDTEFFKIGEPAGSSFVIAVKPAEGPRPAGLLMSPLPAGHIVRYLNGRMLVAALRREITVPTKSDIL